MENLSSVLSQLPENLRQLQVERGLRVAFCDRSFQVTNGKLIFLALQRDQGSQKVNVGEIGRNLSVLDTRPLRFLQRASLEQPLSLGEKPLRFSL